MADISFSRICSLPENADRSLKCKKFLSFRSHLKEAIIICKEAIIWRLEVEADHFSLLRVPAVDQVAEKLSRRALRRVIRYRNDRQAS